MVMWLVGTATVTTQGLTARYDTTNEEWGLLPGQNRGLRLGHQWGLSHGHGHAALDIATGQVTGALKARHRHQGFLAFPKQIERTYRHHLDADGNPVELHLVMDNYAAHTHKRPGVAGGEPEGSSCTSPRLTRRG
ncbi:ISRSO5-transposase protein [Nocardioides sp. CF8]|uniref:hypothetical protein n=1 Tax=Nocardioides sp. CF8 TaxID=110319 RepID=UPI00032FC00F|nr:ISRSO5-transposase protein [Nocardioides sp. CF8]